MSDLSGKSDTPSLQISQKKNESKQFFKALFVIVAPIALQNLITAAVSSADVIMLGHAGQTAIAASSLAGQVQFILILFFTGISSGLIMLTAQYWGKKDYTSIETLSGIAFKVSSAGGIVFFIAAFFFPRAIMHVFTNEKPLIETGASYLRAVSFSYFFLSISQVYQAVLKSMEHVVTVTVITFSALFLNIILNAFLIFGLWIFPEMGIVGAAVATSIARFIEVILCVIVASRVKKVRIRPDILFRKNTALLKDFFHFSLPALGNEFVWGAGFATYSVILGHKGEDIVAANSVVSVARNLASILCFGMAYGGAILLGKEMGSGNLDKAKKDASRLWKSTVLAGLAGAVLMTFSTPLVTRIGHLSAQAVWDARWLVYINAMSIFGAAVNTVMICGIFRAGGDAKFGFIMDCIAMWCVSIPLGVLAAFVLNLHPVLVYLVLYLDEYEKMAVVIHHYRSGRWLKNITRDFVKDKGEN